MFSLLAFFPPEQRHSTWLSGLLSWHLMMSTELNRRSPGKDLLRETPMQDTGEGVSVGEDDLQMIVGPDLWRRRGKEGKWRGRVRDCSTALGKLQPRGGHLNPLFPGMGQHLSSCCAGTSMGWLHKHSGRSTRPWQSLCPCACLTEILVPHAHACE